MDVKNKLKDETCSKFYSDEFKEGSCWDQCCNFKLKSEKFKTSQIHVRTWWNLKITSINDLIQVKVRLNRYVSIRFTNQDGAIDTETDYEQTYIRHMLGS